MSITTEEFKKFLNQIDDQRANKLTYKKISGDPTQSVVDEEPYKQSGINYGLYVTPAFYRGYPNQPFGMTFDQSFSDNVKENANKRRKQSDVLKFDIETINKQRNAKDFKPNQYPPNRDKYLFEFFFPTTHVTGVTIIYRMSIKKLPFEMKYIYSRTSQNAVATTPHINNQTIEKFQEKLNSSNSQSIEQAFNGILTEPFLTDAYDLSLVPTTTDPLKTYSDLILDINKQNYSHSLIDKKQYKNYKHVITKVYEGKISSNKYRISNQINISNKKIHYTKNELRNLPINLSDEKWLSIFSKKIIFPDIQSLPDNYLGYKERLANFYDISFDCDILPVFMYSYFSPGFNVINFKPTAIYGEKDVVTDIANSPEEKSVFINFDEVYKEIFYNKIIELIPSN